MSLLRTLVKKYWAQTVLSGLSIFCLLIATSALKNRQLGQLTFGRLIAFLVLPVGGILFCLLGIFRPRRNQFALAAGTTYLILVLFDWLALGPLSIYLASIRTEHEHDQRVELAKRNGIDFDTRSREEFLQQEQDAGRSFVPFYTPCSFLNGINGTPLIPLGGRSKSPTVVNNETGTFMQYESDRFGFHNPDHLWDLEKVDVVAVGDSFTHGAAVRSDENAIARVRIVFPATINLGTSGSGPIIYLAQLREYASQRSPKIVLWFHFEGNDLLNLRNEYEASVADYLDPAFSQQLSSRQEEVDEALDELADQRRVPSAGRKTIRMPTVSNLKLTDSRTWIERTVDQYAGLSATSEILFVGPQPLRFQEVLRRAQLDCSAMGSQLFFVYLPCYERYFNPPAFRIVDQREITLSIVQELEIPVIDIAEDFAQEKAPLQLFPYGLSGHYASNGYALVAESVIEAIESSQILR